MTLQSGIIVTCRVCVRYLVGGVWKGPKGPPLPLVADRPPLTTPSPIRTAASRSRTMAAAPPPPDDGVHRYTNSQIAAFSNLVR